MVYIGGAPLDELIFMLIGVFLFWIGFNIIKMSFKTKNDSNKVVFYRYIALIPLMIGG